MAFSISFSSKRNPYDRYYQSCQQKPYENWVSNGKPIGATFMYSEHMIDDVMRIIYIPYHDLIYIDMDLDYYHMTATLMVKITPHEKTINIVKVSCSNVNYWRSLLGNDSPKTKSGGVQVFRNNLYYLEGANILEKISKEMFGDEWTIYLSGGARKVSKYHEKFARECFSNIKHQYGPWSKTIGTYDNTIYEKAAVLIQSVYRGWKTRINLRYNPNNRLGYHIISRMFS